MKCIESFSLENYGPFKNLEFKVEPGVTTIYGLNKASGKNSRNSNGVGKSAAFHSLSEILYEEPVVGEKQDSIKAGTRTLQYTTTRGKRILVTRSSNGRSDALKINIDGEDKKFRTSSLARQWFKKNWAISAQEFGTYIHLDSRIPHPLVMGNSAQRKAFFTSFFGLDKIDAERKLYIAELSKLKRVRAAFDELRVQYDRLKAQLLDSEKLESYRLVVKKYKKRLTVLQEEYQSVQETLRLIQFAEASYDQIKQLKVICGGEINEESFAKAKKDNKWEVAAFEEKLEHAQNWENYQRDNSRYTTAHESLSPRTKKLLTKYGYDKLRKKAGSLGELRMHTSVTVDGLKSSICNAEKELSQSLPKKVEKPQEEEGDLETLRRAYKHQLEHATRFKQGKCETCGQVVRIKNPVLLKEKLEDVVGKLNRIRQAEVYEEALAEQKKNRIDLKKWRTQLEVEKAEEDRLSIWESISEELVNLPEEPEAYKGKKLSTKIIKRCLEEVQGIHYVLQHMEPHLDTVVEFLALSREDIKKAKASEGLNDQMSEVQDKLSSVMAKIELHRTIKDQVADMRTRLLEMKTQLKDEPALKHLVQGYQDKNIKKMAVEAISQHLMALVNRYAARIMPEKFTFEFKWDTQIRILVHRHYGKKVKASDVRKLSGAESTLFTIILVCALLAFVPSHKRCNLMILDEPTARFSPAMEEVFKDLLPILNQIVPSIIVITPKLDEIYPGARAYTVVKDKGEAIIVPGFPHEANIATEKNARKK